MSVDRSQDLRVLPGRFVIQHVIEGNKLPAARDWLALVFGPDGRTLIRRDDTAGDSAWTALWSGDEPHDPSATGMLAAIVDPLADAEVPVMVASTFHADLVLIPTNLLNDALGALRLRGHRVET